MDATSPQPSHSLTPIVFWTLVFLQFIQEPEFSSLTYFAFQFHHVWVEWAASLMLQPVWFGFEWLCTTDPIKAALLQFDATHWMVFPFMVFKAVFCCKFWVAPSFITFYLLCFLVMLKLVFGVPIKCYESTITFSAQVVKYVLVEFFDVCVEATSCFQVNVTSRTNCCVFELSILKFFLSFKSTHFFLSYGWVIRPSCAPIIILWVVIIILTTTIWLTLTTSSTLITSIASKWW